VPNERNSRTQQSTNESKVALVILAFALVYVVWGSTYLAMRIGVESFPPVLMAGVRFLIVGLILYPIQRWREGERPTGSQWRTASISGILLFVANGWVCVAEKTVPSGVAALLVATVSLWMVLVDWLRPGGVRPLPRVGAGLILGFAGLALLVGPAHLGGSGRIDPVGSVILIVCSLAWACGSLYAKHGVLPRSPLLGVAMQCLAGGAVLCVLALLKGEVRAFHFQEITLRSWLALGYLITFGSMIGFTSFLYILKNSTAARVGTYAFVNPVVALFLGWLIASESITLRTVLASAIILTAVLLVITAPQKKTAAAQEPLPAPSEA
jgi:drug/metabolite transporter (DMT)-like permease